MKHVTIALLGTAGVVAVLAGLGSFYTVGQGERGVLTTNGALTAISDPGMHFKMPFFQGVTRISLQQNVERWVCAQDGRSQCDSTDHIVMQAYSLDQQPADLKVTVNWRIPIDKVAEVYTQYGSLDALASKVIARKAPQAVKTTFGQYSAVSAIQNRAKFNLDAEAAVKAIADGPVMIDSVQVENIDFSSAYEQSVEARMQAQVEVQKREQELASKKIEAEMTVATAKGAADARVAQATAEATAIKLKGDAEASAIKARADALASNAALVSLNAVDKWDGRLPMTMPPGSAVPFLSLPSPQVQ